MAPKTRASPKPQLTESWVVESGDDEESDYDSSVENNEPDTKHLPSNLRNVLSTSTPSVQYYRNDNPRMAYSETNSPRQRSTRKSARMSVEPELIMPSIGEESNIPGRAHRRKTTARRQDMQHVKGNRHAQDETNLQPSSGPHVDVFEVVIDVFKSFFGHVLDVIFGTLRILKTPLSYLLAICLIIGLLIFTRNLLTSSISSAFSPLCRLPGVTLLNLPVCNSPSAALFSGLQAPPTEFDRLMSTQSKFETILTDAAVGVTLPLDMKRSEASVRDLRLLIRYSSLDSKNELDNEFTGFIETARTASYDLQKFNSHIGRAVDIILLTSKWTLRELEKIEQGKEQHGAVYNFVQNTVLAPFQPVKLTEDKLVSVYVHHTLAVETEISRLVDEAQLMLNTLQKLEDRLDAIHDVTRRESSIADLQRRELLQDLWTKLGGNADKLDQVDSELNMLGHVGSYREQAWAHVTGSLLKLQKMQLELEDINERARSARTLQDNPNVPLRAHIENINLGVQRLEISKEGARKGDEEFERKVRGGKFLELDAEKRPVVQGKLIDGRRAG